MFAERETFFCTRLTKIFYSENEEVTKEKTNLEKGKKMKESRGMGIKGDFLRRGFYVLLLGVGLFLLLVMLGQQIGENAAYVAISLDGEDVGEQKVLQDKTGDAPMVALTFDDGPSKYWTEGLLDGLKERNVKATFFLIGASAEANPQLVERMAAEGHLIGNHTYSHVQLTTISHEAACEEIEETNEVLSKAVGEGIHYIRPPFGSWQKGLDSLVDMQVVLWTVDPQDWKVQNTERIVENVLQKVEDGDIILLHDVYQESVEAALQIIDELQKRGYEFVRVDELLLD